MADPYMLDTSQFAGMFEPDPELVRRANEQAKAMAALRMGMGLLGKEPLGRAAQGGFNTYFATHENERRNALEQQQMALQRMKVMQTMEAEKRAQAMRVQYAQALDPNRARVEQMVPGGPTPENAQRIQPADEWRRYQDAALVAAQAGDRETAKTFTDIASKLQPEWDTTPRPVKDKDGNVRLAIVSKQGQTKYLDNMTPAEKLHFFSTNEQAGIGVDPHTGKQVSVGLPQGISPADKQRLGMEWTRLNKENIPKPPEGYKWKPDGTLEAIPGGPKDTSAKDAIKQQTALERSNMVLGQVEKAIEATGVFTAGLGGSMLGKIPGTPARDLQGRIDSIKANIGFQELQAMREASPTGGALGQVAIQELNMLQAVLASLDREQSPAQLREGLQRVQKHFNNWKKVMRQAGAKVNVGASDDWGGSTPDNDPLGIR